MSRSKDNNTNGSKNKLKYNLNTEKNKTIWKMASWNVRGINGKEIELGEEIRDKNIEIVAITETKKKGKGSIILENGMLLIYSGVEETKRAQAGVACMIKKESINKIKNWIYHNERILRVDIDMDTEETKTNLIICYGPDEDATKNEKNEFWDKLQEVINDCTEKIVITGDMNSRVGKETEKWNNVIGPYGEDKLNKNGKLLLEFCLDNNLVIMNTHFQHKRIHKITREVKSRDEQSIIDYTIVQKTEKNWIRDVRVKRSYEIGSDHYLLETTFKSKRKEIKRNENINRKHKEIIKIYKLREETTRIRYSEGLEKEMDNEHEITETIEEEWGKFKNAMIKTAKSICGTTRNNNRGKRTSWWNDELKREIKEKKKLWKEYIQDKTQQKYENYKRQRTKVKEIVKKEKKKSWEKFGEKMEENSTENVKLFYRTLKNLRSNKETKLKQIMNKEGTIINDDKTIMERWREHFQLILNGNQANTMEKESHNRRVSMRNTENPETIEKEELEEAIRKIKIGKAPGSDEVAPEMMKYIGVKAKEKLLYIYNLIWKRKVIPREWTNAVIIPIYKKGNTRDCRNYRGISLLCVAAKVYETIIERKIRKEIEHKLEDVQSGFRKGHNTQDHIFTMQQVIEKALKKNKEIHLSFIDMEKAFDSVKRKDIWESLKKKQVSEELIEATKSIYMKTTNTVRMLNIQSEPFETTQGVRQGGSLSPVLFINVIDEIVKECKKTFKKYCIGWNRMQMINAEMCIFADDIVLIAETAEKLKYNLEKWNLEASKYNLNVNKEKTQIMKISRKQGTEDQIEVMIDQQKIIQTNSYKYLGTVINNKGDIEDDLNNRMENTGKLFQALNRGFLNNKEISTKTKMTIYKTIYRPTVTYGAENWILNKRHQSRIQAAEMKYLRRTIGVKRTDRIRNEEIRERLKIKPILESIKEKKLAWFGHLTRMDNNRQVKRVWDAKPIGKNRRGRPIKEWNSDISQILQSKGKTWQEATQMASNRKEWRKFVKS
jgi:hypothetical protein